MGVNNRQRRKAKKQQRRQRAQPAAGPRARWGPAPPPFADQGPHAGLGPDDVARDAVLLAVESSRAPEAATYLYALDALARIGDALGPSVVHRAVHWWLDLALDRLWGHGWQPADVIRSLRKDIGARHAEAVGAAVATAGGRRPEAAVDDRWASQVSAIWDDGPPGPDYGGRSPALRLAVESLALLLRLPPIPRLSAPTGRSRRAGGPGSAAMLDRVRALLAKAESTTFPEEAEALAAKAQELMARHAIDAAMLGASRATGEAGVVGWRIGVDDPYADPKSVLLSRIADANRCRSVWCKHLGSSTVFGDRADLEMVELLYTSLLVQGTDAMLRAGRDVDQFGRSRTTSFRKSFLIAYAMRIGERLAAATASVVAESTERYGDALLPVLASRAEAVDESVRTVFPELEKRATAANNYAGWVAGRAAADLATLGVGEALPAG